MRRPQVHIDWRRVKSAVPIFVIAACVAGVFYLQALTISQLSEQVKVLEESSKRQNKLLEENKALATSIEKHAADRTRQIDDLNKHMDCIVKFFSLTDRSQKAIEEINTCRITTSTEKTASPKQQAPATKAAPAKRQPAVRSEPSPPAVQEKQPGVVQRLLDMLGVRL